MVFSVRYVQVLYRERAAGMYSALMYVNAAALVSAPPAGWHGEQPAIMRQSAMVWQSCPPRLRCLASLIIERVHVCSASPEACTDLLPAPCVQCCR